MGHERFGGFGGRNGKREDDVAATAAHLAALEALFTPKATKVAPVSKRDSARMITSRAIDADADRRDDQEVHLELLEHADEARVREAIAAIGRLLDGEPPKRRTLLDARLRRIEDHADEASTRALATELRKKLARAARPL